MPVKKAKRKASTPAKSVKKSVTRTAKKAVAAVKNPKRTVRKAAANVRKTATRAHGVGESMVTAGELIQQTADLVDSLAQGSAKRAKVRRKAR